MLFRSVVVTSLNTDKDFYQEDLKGKVILTVGNTVAIILATTIVCILSRFTAVKDKCPSTVYLLCGIFPLVPGAGIFWFTYYLVSSHFYLSASAGFPAAKGAIAIVLGIIFAMELPQRLFSGKRKG